MAGIDNIEIAVVIVLFYTGLLFLRERLERGSDNVEDR